MTKKVDFSKFGFVFKSMFLDRRGETREGGPEGHTTEQIQEMIDRARLSQSEGAERADKEKEYRDRMKAIEKKEKEDKEKEEKEEKWILRRGKEKFDNFRKESKKFLRGERKGAEVGGWAFILMTVALYIFDWGLRYNGINIQRFLDNLAFTSIESYIGWFFNSIVLTLLIAYYVLYKPGVKEFISWFLVAETFSLIIFLGGMGTALIHLAFVIAFYFLYIRYISGDTPEGHVNANFIFFFLLAFDFFGYGILAELVNNPIVSNRLIIPIWFYFALIYTHEQERSLWINLIIILVILMNVFYFIGGIEGLRSMSATLTDAEKQEGVNFLRTGWNSVKDTFKNAWQGFKSDLESQLIYATGGYYKGQVEKNKIGPLGVYIDKLKTSQPRYYEGEKVIIWGTVRALSLEDGINIKINCHKEDEEKYATEVKPNKTFTVYGLETRDFECVFDPMRTPWFADLGINTITVDAEFNFGTLAYLKSYFMDLERKRGMVREGLDPFKEFGIKDTSPIAVYTDGPVIIGMETTSPIIEVGEGIISQPRLGITLENKEGWEGVIRSLSELVLLIPYGIKIDLNEDPCTVDFKEYEKDDCSGNSLCCYDTNIGEDNLDGAYVVKKGSCETLAFQPCVNVCKGNKKKSESDDDTLLRCIDKCEKTYTNCIKDCDILFEGDEEGKPYNGYAVDVNAENWLTWDIFKDIDRFRSFSCRLDVDSGVLGNTPITVKYFRAKARYNYTLSKDIDVEIQSEPGTSTKIDKKIDVSGLVPGHIDEKITGYARGIIGEDNVNLALALAWKESWHRHCCESSSRNEDENCAGTTEDSCNEDRLIHSYDDSSLGVMQLNKWAHCAWFYPDDICENGVPKTLVDYNKFGCEDDYELTAPQDCDIYRLSNCGGNNAQNIDCNIKLGLNYLEALYEEGKTRHPGGMTYSCNGKTYSDWNYALRGYNGWGCPDEPSKNYVEKVNQVMSDKEWEKYS